MRKSRPDRPSLELDDYSGPFEPDLHISDFSKEGLMKLVEVGGSIYGDVNRQWYKAAIKRFGQEVADEMHHEVWFADGGAGDHENDVIPKLMGFVGTSGCSRWNSRPGHSVVVQVNIHFHRWVPSTVEDFSRNNIFDFCHYDSPVDLESW